MSQVGSTLKKTLVVTVRQMSVYGEPHCLLIQVKDQGTAD